MIISSMNVLQWVLIYGLLAYYSINIVTVIKILKMYSIRVIFQLSSCIFGYTLYMMRVSKK